MSNATTNSEQDTLVTLTPTQQDPGSAKATDFKIADRDGGQCDPALLADVEGLGKPIPDRNAVPVQR